MCQEEMRHLHVVYQRQTEGIKVEKEKDLTDEDMKRVLAKTNQATSVTMIIDLLVKSDLNTLHIERKKVKEATNTENDQDLLEAATIHRRMKNAERSTKLIIRRDAVSKRVQIYSNHFW